MHLVSFQEMRAKNCWEMKKGGEILIPAGRNKFWFNDYFNIGCKFIFILIVFRIAIGEYKNLAEMFSQKNIRRDFSFKYISLIPFD
ncbi:MAG: hypothetical protein A2604_00620 [Candidatus Liptonbacteria bacterium RIFOXYD1_FULL_36_11]|uniref:Uncharacterized protein n=1 Tax=Candidatus Liptonbacteria bacterium RIFOXYD1_FULL_36_11 TaxID=1798656 RepID=A0A1G2CQH9_9BACT|nr:MAG: hypothetical protein A2604_00620 [Candidatus Liptonbacteria bacterium RIFOXYD1_FULL_36_11]